MFELRDYQKELIDGVKNSMADGNKRILVQSAAGSGKSVTMAEIARSATFKGNRVLFVVHRKELVSQIKKTFSEHGVDKELCHVGMIQTITRRLSETEEPTVILVDEAHHSISKTYQRIFDYFPDAYTLGFTATPIRLSGDGLGEVYEDMILGKSIKWLIENERLAPFEYYSVDLANHEKLKKSSTGDYTYKSMSEALGETIFGDVIQHYKRIANGEKAIVYCHNVEMSKKVAAQFNSAGIPTKQVDGKTPKDEREQAMADFVSGKIKILTNAELYGEGVDVPDCSVVILLRPTESLSLFIQQTFRAMRYQPNKTATIIDHVGNVYKHGFPDMDREWTLENKKKRKRTEVEAYPIWECAIDNDGCGMVFSAGDIEKKYNQEEEAYYQVCPDCGAVHMVQVISDKKIDEEAKLEKLETESVEQEYWKRRNWRKAKSYKELQEIGKANGYKPSWSAFKAKELRLPDTPRWVYKWQPKQQFKLNF